MDRNSKFGLALSWTLAMAIGCGGSSTSEPTASTPQKPNSQNSGSRNVDPQSGAQSTPEITVAADPATDPVARVAFDFLDAVLRGDTQRAGAQLTPAAMQQFVENGNQFAPPGIEQASFQIGEVRKPSESQALVQCILTAKGAAGEMQSEEMCCLMKLVEGGWRVSGIAYSMGPQRSPMILDFENPPQSMGPPVPMADGTQTSSEQFPENPGRPSPRTAQESPAPVVR